MQESDKIGCRSFVSPDDIVSGNYKLNLAFVANLFNNYPALDKKDDIDLESLQIHEETREEKSWFLTCLIFYNVLLRNTYTLFFI